MTISVAGIQRMGVTPVARPTWLDRIWAENEQRLRRIRAAARLNVMYVLLG
jgi:hypothetical protein